jgi:hypothetical protein
MRRNKGIRNKCVSTPIKLPVQTKVQGLFDAVIRSDYCRTSLKGSIGNKCVSTPIKLPVQTKVQGLFDAVIRSDYCRTSLKGSIGNKCVSTPIKLPFKQRFTACSTPLSEAITVEQALRYYAWSVESQPRIIPSVVSGCMSTNCVTLRIEDARNCP